ncbi:UDP-N-acetylglucosamine 4,6-dehydratase, partial [bacterium]|nr:UDP-N-acetylglucosamine 4,6-dehydratase [bacterium]
EQLHLTTFSDIAERYIDNFGFEPYHCSTEQEARERTDELIASKRWPCYFFKSDTSGEKDFEEFFTDNEILDMNRFQNLGVIKNEANFSSNMLDNFLEVINNLRVQSVWEKAPIVDLFNEMIPDFHHKETGKYLDEKM